MGEQAPPPRIASITISRTGSRKNSRDTSSAKRDRVAGGETDDGDA